jgi:hypothetical protein
MSKGCARVSSREKIYWKSLVREDEWKAYWRNWKEVRMAQFWDGNWGMGRDEVKGVIPGWSIKTWKPF